MDKWTIWLVAALVAYILFRDRLFAEGGVSGGFSAGTNPYQGPPPGPSPSRTSYGSTPPVSGKETNAWDFFKSLGQGAVDLVNGGNVHYNSKGGVSF